MTEVTTGAAVIVHVSNKLWDVLVTKGYSNADLVQPSEKMFSHRRHITFFFLALWGGAALFVRIGRIPYLHVLYASQIREFMALPFVWDYRFHAHFLHSSLLEMLALSVFVGCALPCPWIKQSGSMRLLLLCVFFHASSSVLKETSCVVGSQWSFLWNGWYNLVQVFAPLFNEISSIVLDSLDSALLDIVD